MSLARSIRRLFRKREKAAAKRKKAYLEPLEPRILLSDMSYSADTGAAIDATLRLQDVGGVDTVQLINNSDLSVLAGKPLTDFGAGDSVVITGSDRADRLTIDFTNPFSILTDFTDDYDSDGDTLQITGGGDRTWSIIDANSGVTGTVTFGGVESLVGGVDSDDTFMFAGGSLSGAIDGGAGIDTLNYSLLGTGVTVDLSDGSATGTGGVSHIENIIGSMGADTLIGDWTANVLYGWLGNDSLAGGAGDDTYVFDADLGLGIDTIIELAGGGTDTLDFSSTATRNITIDLSITSSQAVSATLNLTLSAGDVIENVIGGSGADTIIGNALYNVFTGGAGADALTGGGGIDTIVETRDANFTLIDTSLTIGVEADVLSGIEAARLTGGTGANTLNASAFTLGPVRLDGAGGNDTLRGGSGDDLLIGGAGTNTMRGGGGDDTYVLTPGAVNTVIDTGGTDTLDYSAYTASDPVTASLLGGTPTGLTGSVAGIIENVIGGAGNDILTGDANANRLVGGGGTNTLTGGNGDDTYALTPGAVNTISDSAGNDTLDYSAYTEDDPVTASLVAGTPTGLTGSVVGIIENVIGGAGDDILTGDANANRLSGGPGSDTVAGGAGDDTYLVTSDGGADTIVEVAGGGNDEIRGPDEDIEWVVTGADSGTVAGATFSNIENLVGGAGDDSFVFEAAGSISGSTQGGGQVFGDTVVGPDAVNTWTISGGNAGTLNGTSDFTGIENLLGGDTDDTFSFQAGGAISGLISGGGERDGMAAPVDRLDYSALAAGVEVDLAAMTATGFVGGFAAIDKIKGGSGADTIYGPDEGVVEWTIDGADAGEVGGVRFEGFEYLAGASTASDAFTFEENGSLSGTVDGGTGSFDSFRVFKAGGGYTTFNAAADDEFGTVVVNSEDHPVCRDGPLDPVRRRGRRLDQRDPFR